MNLIMDRGTVARQNHSANGVHAFNTFFYPRLLRNGHQAVKRWTKRLDVLACRYIVVPVHLGMHWCMAVSEWGWGLGDGGIGLGFIRGYSEAVKWWTKTCRYIVVPVHLGMHWCMAVSEWGWS